jgi:hypothetical protein
MSEKNNNRGYYFDVLARRTAEDPLMLRQGLKLLFMSNQRSQVDRLTAPHTVTSYATAALVVEEGKTMREQM